MRSIPFFRDESFISGRLRNRLQTETETEVGSDPLADVPCLPELPKLIRLKYSTEINRWTRLRAAVGRLWADTGGKPERSLVWRELLSAYDVSDVASAVFRDRFGCWGFLDLWRIGGGHFTDPEIDYLAAIAPPVTERLRRLQAETFLAQLPPSLPEGAAVLVLAADLQVRAQTAQTEAHLRALLPPDGDRPPIPAGAYNVGAQLIANEAGRIRHAEARNRPIHLREHHPGSPESHFRQDWRTQSPRPTSSPPRSLTPLRWRRQFRVG
jgi:hypothetical protein